MENYWGITDDDRCVLCSVGVERRGHLFFECPFSKNKKLRISNGLNRDALCFKNESSLISYGSKDFKVTIRNLRLRLLFWSESEKVVCLMSA